MSHLKTLIISAFPQELQFIDSNQLPQAVKTFSTGIGPVAATFGLTQFLQKHQPQQIIALATAGIIQKNKYNLGDIVVAEIVATHAGSLQTYVPQIQESVIHCTPRIHHSLKKAKVYAPQEITRGQEWADFLTQTDFDVEHLESFAWAYVAQKFGIPATIILGLTNFVGPHAHQQWQQNEAAVMQKITQNILPLFSSI